MRRTTLSLGAAVLIMSAAITWSLRSDSAGPVIDATSSTTTTAPLATWFDEAEIVVPPVVIVPTRVEVTGGAVVVEYDLIGMAGDAPLRPTVWTLITTDGHVTAEVDPSASRVTFDAGFDFDATTIEGLRLDEYVLRSPIRAWFRPSPSDFTTYEIAPGVTAALDIIQEQTQGAIVRVQLGAAIPGAVQDLSAEGVGPGWVTASSNFGGGGQWTLSFDGSALPDPLPIQVRGIMWIPVPAAIESSLQGVPID